MLDLAAGLLEGYRARAATSRPWRSLARPEQLAPEGAWELWLILAGRGWGKTRTGAEWLNESVMSVRDTQWALVAKTFALARDVCVEGPVGVLACAQPGEIAKWDRSLGHITYANGSKVFLSGHTDADRLRGFNLAGAWLDEPATYRNLGYLWDECLRPAVRDQRAPCRIVATTTGKPNVRLRELRDASTTVVTRGSTRDNEANLAPSVVASLYSAYAGTRIGRQELDGDILDDVEGALWKLGLIDEHRITDPESVPDFERVVVAIDPAATAHEGSNETGIVVVGLAAGHLYVLGDRSGRYSPQAWAATALAALDAHGGDRLVAEVNNGGDMVAAVIRGVDPAAPVRSVHASRGKLIRAEPIAALYEQGRVHHVGAFPTLEDQLTTWTPGEESPDRLDALVWACTDLVEGSRARRGRITYVSRRVA